MGKKGLAGTYDFGGLATKGHQEMLGLPDGFTYMHWGPHDPRVTSGVAVDCEWYPMLWGDSQHVIQFWLHSIPRTHEGRAYFLNEPDLPAVPNEQGHAESAGMTPKAAASLFFWCRQMWPGIQWIGPNISQRDCLVKGPDGKYNPWLRAFLAELWVWRSYALSVPMKNMHAPFSGWERASFHLYPMWPDDMPVEMTEVDWYVQRIIEALRESGLTSASREQLWVTETNSNAAWYGPDFPPPPDKPPGWYPPNKANWPGVRRWRKWVRDFEAHPNIEKWLGFIGTAATKPHYEFISVTGGVAALTENGKVFAEVV